MTIRRSVLDTVRSWRALIAFSCLRYFSSSRHDTVKVMVSSLLLGRVRRGPTVTWLGQASE